MLLPLYNPQTIGCLLCSMKASISECDRQLDHNTRHMNNQELQVLQTQYHKTPSGSIQTNLELKIYR